MPSRSLGEGVNFPSPPYFLSQINDFRPSLIFGRHDNHWVARSQQRGCVSESRRRRNSALPSSPSNEAAKVRFMMIIGTKEVKVIMRYSMNNLCCHIKRCRLLSALIQQPFCRLDRKESRAAYLCSPLHMADVRNCVSPRPIHSLETLLSRNGAIRPEQCGPGGECLQHHQAAISGGDQAADVSWERLFG